MVVGRGREGRGLGSLVPLSLLFYNLQGHGLHLSLPFLLDTPNRPWAVPSLPQRSHVSSSCYLCRLLLPVRPGRLVWIYTTDRRLVTVSVVGGMDLGGTTSLGTTGGAVPTPLLTQ